MWDWRHNDQQSQPAATNWVSSRDSETESNMEVDQDPLQNVMSDQNHQLKRNPSSAISKNDFYVSRQHVTHFLQQHTVYEMLPESGKVIVLDVTLPVKQAFHTLYEQGIPVAPLWDSEKQMFVGMLSASDFITILRQLGFYGAMLPEEELDTHTIAAWKGEKVAISMQDNMLQMSSCKRLVSVGPDDSLKHAADTLLKHSVTTLPVLHYDIEDAPQLLYLASLGGILKCVWRHFRQLPSSLPLFVKPIFSLSIGSWSREIGSERPLVMLSPDASLTTAFTCLLQAGVSALPVVDENGTLLDVYARSDITALAKDHLYARVQLESLTVSQALQIVQDCHNTQSQSNARFHMCLRTDTLRLVIERLTFPGVQRLICVEAGSRKVEGMISLEDVFRFFLS